MKQENTAKQQQLGIELKFNQSTLNTKFDYYKRFVRRGRYCFQHIQFQRLNTCVLGWNLWLEMLFCRQGRGQSLSAAWQRGQGEEGIPGRQMELPAASSHPELNAGSSRGWAGTGTPQLMDGPAAPRKISHK